MKAVLALVLSLGCAFFCAESFADTIIQGPEISPSTTLATLSLPGTRDSYPVSELVDGITDPGYPGNGFASTESSGVIRFDFLRDWNLVGFKIWNDVNVGAEGIKDFKLEFFDQYDNAISTSAIFTAPFGQVDAGIYNFDVVVGARRADLIVLNSYPYTFNRIEIREVQFMATSVAVPEPNMFGIFLAGLVALFLLGRHRLTQPERN